MHATLNTDYYNLPSVQSLEGRMVELEKDHRDLERRHLNVSCNYT